MSDVDIYRAHKSRYLGVCGPSEIVCDGIIGFANYIVHIYIYNKITRLV